ncbi:MAG: DUF4398 domain-containing protein [Pseudomonadota bacterium]
MTATLIPPARDIATANIVDGCRRAVQISARIVRLDELKRVMSPNVINPVGWATLALAALLVGCAGVPSQKMSDARWAIQKAREHDAARYAPWTLERADDAIAVATDALNRGDYGPAGRHADSAKGYADSARRIAQWLTESQALLGSAPPNGALDRLFEQARVAANRGEESEVNRLVGLIRQQLGQ